MELAEDVVIVGAGIAGLTTSLGLHRLGIRTLVLESADCLRITGRCGIRGSATFDNNHGFEPLFNQFFGHGVRFGTISCDPRFVYWYFTFSPSPDQVKEFEENPSKAREFVLSKLGVIPDGVRGVFESTELEAFKLISPLRYRKPWELLWKSFSKGNVCVAGDALHPMTPDLGQGGCSALEDGVVLARCLGEVLLRNSGMKIEKVEEEYKSIEMGLKKYGRERKWRCFDLVATAYAVGYVQQSDNKVLSFLRNKFLAPFLVSLVLNKADFDCGKLTHNS